MPNFIRLHITKLVFILLSANTTLLIFLAAGDVKALSVWSGADIFAEGGAGLLTLVWLYLILKSRPSGRITNLLTLGLGLMFVAWWADTLDEFIALPDAITWDHWLESGSMSLGLVLLTYGLYHWHHEQLAISQQRQKQERLVREHRYFDHLTPLAGAQYLKDQIDSDRKQSRQYSSSLIALDLDNFDAVNQTYGHAEGDRVLQAVSQIILLNIRNQDLLCRLAGDRFVVLLPHTGESQAKIFADEITNSLFHYAYRSYTHGEKISISATSAVIMAHQESSEQLLSRLQLAIAKAKTPLARRA
ncbi:GGDEF domain-containing protein [Halioxenophilus aromaticivorans]|uniref:GGDEF domain-containing protein n=1 Tax=Halioxenophilus aromaticivorans TaxID=1306992 RepID=UPI0031E6E4A8